MLQEQKISKRTKLAIITGPEYINPFYTGFMRSGNTYTSNGAAEMIKEIIANLRDEVDNTVF